MSIFEFMIAPFAACMVLIGILGYFGIHVIKREIIFIDIAMAQIAALGMTFAFLFNIDFHSNLAYLFSVGFTTIAASIFAAIKDKDLHVPLEAIIGLSYAIATTAAVIIIDRAPGGAEHIKEMLVGSILFVSWGEILKATVAFVIVGALHFVFRDKFISISEDSQKASDSGINVKLWDFIFYISLGIAVIHAVRIGGILMVFAFLIIPSSIAILFSKSWTARILSAWLVGTIVSMGGLYLSWVYNLPSGPAVIVFLGLFFFLAMTVKKLNLLKSS
ncbi:metal ABC transporter permease [candidate division KSB1 bacterium]|nr:metal ABC transporter permease [candidate division KSB1 bacterium]